MKALVVSALYPPRQVGGAEKIAQVVTEGLAAAGHDCVVLTTMPGWGAQRSRVNGIDVHSIGLRNLYWPHERRDRMFPAKPLWHALERYNPLMGRQVARILDSERPDVVHTHSLTGFSCAAWHEVKARGIPLVHTLHDYSLMCPRTSMFQDGRNCDGQCRTCAAFTGPARRISARVDAVVGVSRFTLERHLASGYFGATARREVILNAIAAPRAAVARDERTARPLRLGYVGQLVPAKGVRVLVEQMRAWSPQQCRLVVAGSGARDYEDLLREGVGPNVRMLGFVDPRQVYESIDVLVVPSLWEEPLGMIVLEAYMQGVPVIAAHRGGLPEIVDHGVTGLLYEPGQPQALHDAIDGLVRHRGRLDALRAGALAKASAFLGTRMQAQYAALVATVATAA
ncbi:glycosyltransferase family 4 protein [Ramlibacter sp. PS4R-6]|uniref:glycosyltransferase family 4 protein n=1 Tax=Ramlibacter sp. PS4R-6 TaxID=3133438 RepID=UPI0030960724